MKLNWATIGRNLAFVLSSTGFQALCSLTALALNARALGAGAFGTLAIIQAYASVIASLTTFETWQAVIRIGTGSRRRLRPALVAGMLLDAVAAASATIIALVGILLFAPALGIAESTRSLAAVYCVSLLFGLTGTPKGYLRLLGRYDILAGFQAGQAFAAVTVSVILFSLQAPLTAYVIAFAAIEAIHGVAMVIMFLVFARPERLAPAMILKSPRARLHLLHLARVATGTSVLSTLLTGRRQLPVIVAASILNAQSTGLLAFAARLTNIVQRVSTALNQVVFPEMIAVSTWSDRRAAQRLAMAVTTFTVVVFGCATALVYVFAETIVVIAGGEEFRGAAALFVLLFASECAASAAMPLYALVQGLTGVRPLLAITSVSLLLIVVLAVAFASSMGPIGIALASLAASILAYVGVFVSARWGLSRKAADSDRAVGRMLGQF